MSDRLFCSLTNRSGLHPNLEKLYTPLLLIGSNLFMTYAWYGHLQDQKSAAF